MEENRINTSEDSLSAILHLFYKNLFLIILCTILCGLLATGYSILKVKPVYTANRSVILRMTVDVETEKGASSATNNATLAKIYLYDVAETICSPVIIDKANNYYGEQKIEQYGKIKSSNVTVKYGEESLIFSVSYRALNENEAKEKLELVIKSVAEELHNYVEASNVTLVDVQSHADVSVSSSFSKNVVIGIFIGAVLGAGIVFLKYTMDNTVGDKEELERLTDVDVIAYIDKA